MIYVSFFEDDKKVVAARCSCTKLFRSVDIIHLLLLASNITLHGIMWVSAVNWFYFTVPWCVPLPSQRIIFQNFQNSAKLVRFFLSGYGKTPISVLLALLLACHYLIFYLCQNVVLTSTIIFSLVVFNLILSNFSVTEVIFYFSCR